MGSEKPNFRRLAPLFFIPTSKCEGVFLGNHDDGRAARRDLGGMVEGLFSAGLSCAFLEGLHRGEIDLRDSIERSVALRGAQYLGGDEFCLSGKLGDGERHVLLQIYFLESPHVQRVWIGNNQFSNTHESFHSLSVISASR